jgi:hypothetical protein
MICPILIVINVHTQEFHVYCTMQAVQIITYSLLLISCSCKFCVYCNRSVSNSVAPSMQLNDEDSSQYEQKDVHYDLCSGIQHVLNFCMGRTFKLPHYDKKFITSQIFHPT